MAFSATKIRNDFPVLSNSGIRYLDSAATAQRPEQVIRAEAAFYTNVGANAHRGVYGLAVESTRLYERARTDIAAFARAKPGQLAFVRNATEAINLVAWAWAAYRCGPDKNIVTTVMEHHSNLVPWQLLAQKTGCELRFAGITGHGMLDMDDLNRLVDKNTVLVAVSHISNVLGVVNPVTRICAMAHDRGAACLVDGAQGLPHLPVDVQAMGCDFYAFSGHKMMGPMGIGGLIIADSRLEQMHPFLGGGEMIDRVKLESATYAPPPLMFEAGTQNVGGVIGLAAAVRYLNSLGMDRVREHEKFIGEYARSRVGRINGIRIIGPGPENGGSGGILTMDIAGHHPHDVAQFLDGHGIAVRAGDHCAQPLHERLGLTATTRASFYIYNTMEDVDALAAALKDLMTGKKTVSVNSDDEYMEVLDYHFQNPMGRDELESWEIEKQGMNALCGDELTLRLHITDNRIEGVHADARGCKISQASASLMAGAVQGQDIKKAKDIARQVQTALMGGDVELTGELAALQPLAKMPARLKCALLAWKTLEEALSDGND